MSDSPSKTEYTPRGFKAAKEAVPCTCQRLNDSKFDGWPTGECFWCVEILPRVAVAIDKARREAIEECKSLLPPE